MGDMRWYSIDIAKLFIQLLPMRLRRLNMVLFLYALSMPLSRLVERVLYTMQHDSRVIYLEKVLNEAAKISTYDAGRHVQTRVIYIGPGEIPEEVYLFKENEPDVPPFIGITAIAEDGDAVWLHTQTEQDAEYCDFTVWVPRSLEHLETRLRYLVNYYKMAGKKYKLRWI